MFYQKEVSEVLSDFHSSTKGLNENDAQEILKRNGQNIIKSAKKDSLIKKIMTNLTEPLILILIISSIISAIVEKENYIETIIIVIVIVINVLFELYESFKADNAIKAIQKMQTHIAKVKRNDKVQTIDSSMVVCGDIILLEAGDYIPADARIIECNNLSVDESALTGESINVSKVNTALKKENLTLAEMKNMIFSSTYVTSGTAKAVVCDTGMNTVIGSIAAVLLNNKDVETPLQIKLKQISKVIGIFCIIICVVIFFFEIFSGIPVIDSFKIAVALAVAAIPEGLSTVVAIVLSIGISKMSKKNAIVKKMTSVETLGCCDIIASDKTGTLTQNKLIVEAIYSKHLIKDFTNLDETSKFYLSLLAMCTDIFEDKGSYIGDSTDIALYEANEKYGKKLNYEKISEVPFDSAAKMMSVVVKVENRYLLICKGAYEVIIKKCLNPRFGNKIKETNEQLTNDALRVIAMGYKYLPNKNVTDDNYLEFGCIIGMLDKERPDVYSSIEIAKKAHIKTIMITGDHINTAKTIARRLNILSDDSEAILSSELKKMSDQELFNNIEKYSVYARCEPLDKLRIVETLQKKNHIVAMTGDGVNDALSLKKADIGCAMGSGTEVAKNVSEIILTDDNYSTIVESIKIGRNIYENIKRTVRYLLSSNIGEVLIIFLVSVIGIMNHVNLGVPLLAIHLLWINLITDSLPAFGLGLEGSSDRIMTKKPRNKKESFFSNNFGLKIIAEGIIIGLITLGSFFVGYLISDNISVHQTMAFTTLSMAQLLHSYNVKSSNSLFHKSTLNNKFLNLSFICGLILLFTIIYIPTLSKIFKLYPLEPNMFLISIALAFGITLYSEVIKRLIKNY